MSNTKGNGIGPLIKYLVITLLKLVAIVLAAGFKILALVLSKISELLEKISGHGTAH